MKRILRIGVLAIPANAAIGFVGRARSNLTVLEPYRPIFIGAALRALFLA